MFVSINLSVMILVSGFFPPVFGININWQILCVNDKSHNSTRQISFIPPLFLILV